MGLSTEIRQQITNDAFLMNYAAEGYRPVWVFGDAPPSPALARALAEARIPYLVYGDRVAP